MKKTGLPMLVAALCVGASVTAASPADASMCREARELRQRLEALPRERGLNPSGRCLT